MRHLITRRGFVQAATAASLVSRQVTARASANERINLGIIGAGGRGMELWRDFLAQPDVNPVAVCDVYQPHLERAVAAAPGGKVKAYRDFRHLLDEKEIQAVVIATPDHWHAVQTILACEAGKDVYVEKPLSLTVSEGRAMVNSARRHGRIVQVGSQQRSGSHYLLAVELIKSGELGAVSKITAGYTRNILPGFKAKDTRTDLLDWDMWLGPARYVPFDPFRCIYNFRWFWDYSGGQMTNWGAHHLDIARWALGAKGPLKVAAFGGRYWTRDGGETPDVQEVIYEFPKCVVTWTTREVSAGGENPGLLFHGTKATMSINRGEFALSPETWKGADADDAAEASPRQGRLSGSLLTSHVRNFLDAVKSRQTPIADVEEGHRTATMCHLGNIAMRLGRSIKWDADHEVIEGDPEANQYLTKANRNPWQLKQLSS